MGRYKRRTPEESAQVYKDDIVGAVASALWNAPMGWREMAQYAVHAVRAWDKLNSKPKRKLKAKS